jgi:hypothetical protein
MEMLRPQSTALSAILLCALAVSPCFADEPSARDWLLRSQNARFPAKNMVAEFTIDITNADGSKLERKGRSVRATREDSLSDRLFVITQPRSISGMTLLSKDVVDGPANQWLYLPAYRRVRRVAIHGAGDAFVGSDFYYADLARVRIEAGGHSLKGETSVSGRLCILVETRHEDAQLPYGRTVSALDKETALPMRVEYFDRKDVLVKVGTIDSVESHAGHPTPVALTMRNEATGSRSRILLDSVLYDSDLDEGMFTVERLEEQGPPH